MTSQAMGMPDRASAKEEIKRAADIVQVIGQYVQLRKAGKNFMGLCPFHAEKTPSLMVNPERQVFHCFGCKKGGDVFAFWMDYHGVTFVEALKDLAERYGIAIRETFSSGEERKKAHIREALFEINEAATDFFQRALAECGDNEPIRRYLRKRGLTREIIQEFRLGFAPDSWQGLTNYLSRSGLGMERAVQAGLIIPKRGGGYYDRFRGRLMFPICNLRGQVVGFGGRVLDNSLPKYLNTPETPIFHKGEIPYGLHASYEAIRRKGRVVIVEGYMDFLALRKHGLQEVVATLGTALTQDHIRKIKGYGGEAVVVFDSDEAGRMAALRSLPLFLNEGLPARAVALPQGHDPDTFVHQNGLAAFLECLERAVPMLDFFLDHKLAGARSDIEGKVGVLKEILPALAQLRNRAQRALYIGRISERMGVREEVILAELDADPAEREGATTGRLLEEKSRLRGKQRIGDLQVLNLLLHHPAAVQGLMESDCIAILSDPVSAEIVKKIFEVYRREGGLSPECLEEGLEGEEARIRMREVMVAESIYSEEEVRQAILEVEEKARQQRFAEALKAAAGNPEALNRLLRERKNQESLGQASVNPIRPHRGGPSSQGDG